MKATFDFDNKTIQFEGKYKLSDVHRIQDMLDDWQEWTVIQFAAPVSIPTVWVDRKPTSPYWEVAPYPSGPWPGGTITVTGSTANKAS